MKHSIKIIIVACLSSASSFAVTNDALHFARSNRSVIPATRSRRALKLVVATEKRVALKLEEVHALIASASRRHGVPSALVKSMLPPNRTYDATLSPHEAQSA
jgi:hypothetical protein